MSLIMAALNKVRQEAAPVEPVAPPQTPALPETPDTPSVFINEEELIRLMQQRHPVSPILRKGKPAARLLWWLPVLGGVAALFFLVQFISGFWVIESQVQRSVLDETPGKVMASMGPTVPGFNPAARLEGIFFDDKDPLCLIDGKILRAGDQWQNYEIVRIQPSEVTLVNPEGQLLHLKLV